MKFYMFLTGILLSVSGFAQQTFAPVNPNTSPEARKVLTYIYSIKGKQIISGQHNYNQQLTRHIDSVVAITGKEPALWGADFIWNGKQDNGQAIVNEAIKKKQRRISDLPDVAPGPPKR